MRKNFLYYVEAIICAGLGLYTLYLLFKDQITFFTYMATIGRELFKQGKYGELFLKYLTIVAILFSRVFGLFLCGVLLSMIIKSIIKNRSDKK